MFKLFRIIYACVLFLVFGCSKSDTSIIDTDDSIIIDHDILISVDNELQTIEGFGASLAYYENWLTEHPKKNEIYEAIFGELGLDILRIRNSHDYDESMISRVVEFANAAETSLGYPIAIMSTSWGPPAYLKSNNDRKNGGTLKHTVIDNNVNFDYAGFANWWKSSLDEYNNNGVYPTYIGIQNEPEFETSYESCLLFPSERITNSDTIAGYDKALEAVYNMVQSRSEIVKIIGPETVGIGYNKVEEYTFKLNTSQLYGLAHHLYHGVDLDDPYNSSDFQKIGNHHPNIPHFQTEYGRGNWFDTANLICRSFYDENVVAYLYWDLIWDGGGLVALDFPWDNSLWNDPAKGYIKTKEYYAFKQFSAFIHSGWTRVTSSLQTEELKTLAFINASKNAATIVIINRSDYKTSKIEVSLPNYKIENSTIFRTSETEDCVQIGELTKAIVELHPHSITTVELTISKL